MNNCYFPVTEPQTKYPLVLHSLFPYSPPNSGWTALQLLCATAFYVLERRLQHLEK